MKNESIPVVLAADDNYGYQLITTMASILDNGNKETSYHFILLVSQNFSDDKEALFYKLVQQYETSYLSMYRMPDTYDGIEMKISHITPATYYRLNIPHLLADIKKCIYLDVDVIVESDLSELYNINMDNYYMAGVKAAGYYYPLEKQQDKADVLGIEKFDRYLNAGVLVMNLQKLREDNMEEAFTKLLDKKFSSQDQDILNCACYPKIKILPPKFNLMTKYHPSDKDTFQTVSGLKEAYSEQEWQEACARPKIIHYADKKKPWIYLTSDYATAWWNYAKIAGIEMLCFEKLYEQIGDSQKRAEHNINELTGKLQAEQRHSRELQESRQKEIEKRQKEMKEKEHLQELLEVCKKKNETLISQNTSLEIKNKKAEVSKQKGEANLEKCEAEKTESQKKNKKLEERINKIEKSNSYKIGRFLTFIPRKLKGCIKRLKSK